MSLRLYHYVRSSGDAVARHYIVSTFAELPVTSLVVGSTAYAEDTGSFYTATSTTIWTALGGGLGAPIDADYLVGTANAGLSAEIVVGTSPGGELGGTWGSPTVDATHSGSAHHAEQHAMDSATFHTSSDLTTLDASTLKHGFVPKLPGGTTTFFRADGTFATPAGAAPAFTEVEVSLGSAPKARRNGKFSITSAGLTVGKHLHIKQANGPYTGKGMRPDEAEMDQVLVSGKVTSTTNIDCYWEANHRVRGNYKFAYMIGA